MCVCVCVCVCGVWCVVCVCVCVWDGCDSLYGVTAPDHNRTIVNHPSPNLARVAGVTYCPSSSVLQCYLIQCSISIYHSVEEFFKAFAVSTCTCV